jgi:exo-beta-1,3-glucanase (GH17 family)
MVAAPKDQIAPGRKGRKAGFALALIAALLSLAAPCRADPVLAGRVSAAPARKPLDYLCYSPYRDGQAPGGASPTEAQIRADLALIAPLAKGIRTYSVAGILARIPDLAREAGLEVYVGAWVGKDEGANLAEVDALIALAKAGNPAIKGLIVGNEVLLRHDVPAERLLAYIQRVREAKTGIPITTADIYQDLIEHAAELAPLIDFALCHAHPYWEELDAGSGADRVLQGWNGVKAKYPGKPVLVGETGFPTAGQTRGAAIPGEAAQARFLGDLLAIAAREGMPVMWFEAFDEAWKGVSGEASEGLVGAHWGLWNSDRTEKPALAAARATTGLLPPGADGSGPSRRSFGTGGASLSPILPALGIDALGRQGAAQAEYPVWGRKLPP